MRRYRKRLYALAALFAFLGITACGRMQERPEPIIRTVEVKVPVTVPCEAAEAVGEPVEGGPSEMRSGLNP